jgi:hypothetical protein
MHVAVTLSGRRPQQTPLTVHADPASEPGLRLAGDAARYAKLGAGAPPGVSADRLPRVEPVLYDSGLSPIGGLGPSSRTRREPAAHRRHLWELRLATCSQPGTIFMPPRHRHRRRCCEERATQNWRALPRGGGAGEHLQRQRQGRRPLRLLQREKGALHRQRPEQLNAGANTIKFFNDTASAPTATGSGWRDGCPGRDLPGPWPLHAVRARCPRVPRQRRRGRAGAWSGSTGIRRRPA